MTSQAERDAATRAGEDSFALSRVKSLAERWKYTEDRKGARRELLAALDGSALQETPSFVDTYTNPTMIGRGE